MTYTVKLISPVIGNGKTTPFHPQFSDDYPLLTYSDITALESSAQPGDPPVMILVTETDNLAVLEADDRYFVMEIIQNEENGNSDIGK